MNIAESTKECSFLFVQIKIKEIVEELRVRY